MSDAFRLVAEIQWGGPGALDERLVAWAIDTLLSGQETRSLVLLAGLTRESW